MISRNTLRIAAVGNGPGFAFSSRSKISSSRAGTNGDAPPAAFSRPISALRRARSFKSARIRASIASISSRSAASAFSFWLGSLIANSSNGARFGRARLYPRPRRRGHALPYTAADGGHRAPF